jgi:hypothetical protein
MCDVNLSEVMQPTLGWALLQDFWHHATEHGAMRTAFVVFGFD